MQQPQQQGAAATDAGQVPAEQQPVSRPPSSDCCDLTTFHVVSSRSTTISSDRILALYLY